MSQNVARELAALHRLTVPQLRSRYAEVFGETTNANNRAWLVKKIAWRMQALAEGGLSERALRRAAELAHDADLRANPPPIRADDTLQLAGPARSAVAAVPPRDPRLPPVGSVLARLYRGQSLQVRVLVNGFEFDGHVYPSLSAVARHITGSHCNGYLFFRLTGKGGPR